MEIVKKTDSYTITKKNSGRFAVLDPKKRYIKGEEKVKILLKEKLIKLTPPSKKAAETPKEGEAAVASEAKTS